MSPRVTASILLGVTLLACGDDSTTTALDGDLDMNVDPCLERIDVILEPGQHQAFDGDRCLFLPAGSGDRYRVAVTRPTIIENPDDTPIVWLELDQILAAQQASRTAADGAGTGNDAPGPTPGTGAPDPSAGTASPGVTEPPAVSRVFEGSDRIDGARFVRDQRIMQRTARFHAELRRRELELNLRAGPLLAAPPGPARAAALADPPSADSLFLALECSSSVTKTPVTLVDFNDDVAIYQDDESFQTDPLPLAATRPMLDYYADHVRGFIEQYWGNTPDIDQSGRVILATTDALPDSAAAAVFSGDFRPTSACPSSNEGEIMYFAADVIRAVGLDPSDPNQSFLGLSVMAHEVKHVTSLFNSIARGAFHSTWIEEGTAEISQTMSSRIAWAAVGGPPVGAKITGQDIIEWNDQNGGIGPEAWGIIVQLGEVIIHQSTQPNSLITNPAGASRFHNFYAGGWHWHRFLGDAFGNASTPLGDGPLFAQITDSLTAAGTGALLQATGRTFEQLFEDMVVAASLHEVGPSPNLTFTTWDLTTATAIFSGPPDVAPPHRYPWPVTADVPTDPNAVANPSRSFATAVYSCPPKIVGNSYQAPDPSERCPMGPSGVRYHDFTSDGSGLGAQIRVFGAEGGRLIVTRLN